VVERIKLSKLKMQTWAVPRYNFQVINFSSIYMGFFLSDDGVQATDIFTPLQYGLSWETESINDLIEKAILDADARGVKVLTLGLLNQARNYYIAITTPVETTSIDAYCSVSLFLYLLGTGETTKWRWRTI
jgi:hypothetical protein